MNPLNNLDDLSHMRYALRLAARGLGRTAPNPAVGAVVVRDGAIIGIGSTAPGGRPHAEPQALAMAGEAARGATLYVTLEPCNHHGKTPPCAGAVIEAGIARVVIACSDPNPAATGGAAALRAACIAVTEGVLREEAYALNEGFFSVLARGRPFVTLKLATSADGSITGPEGETVWLTNEQSRRRVHLLRAEHDAILTGIGTLLADDPQLTCRLPGREADSPSRILLDAKLRMPPSARLLPALIITSEQALATKEAAALRKRGAELLALPLGADGLDLPALLALLAKRGVTRLLVEAGQGVATSFVRQKLADRISWFRSPRSIGAGGMPALREYDLSNPALPGYRWRSAEPVLGDRLDILEAD